MTISTYVRSSDIYVYWAVFCPPQLTVAVTMMKSTPTYNIFMVTDIQMKQMWEYFRWESVKNNFLLHVTIANTSLVYIFHYYLHPSGIDEHLHVLNRLLCTMCIFVMNIACDVCSIVAMCTPFHYWSIETSKALMVSLVMTRSCKTLLRKLTLQFV